MSASLPEQTVELWVAAVITAHFPNAEIWAPTPADHQHFDVGARTGGKLFVLECKRTDPLKSGGHTIPIDAAQLAAYVGAAKYAAFRSAIYYVLPKPPWSGLPAPKPIPAQARHRVAPVECDLWMYVIGAAALAGALGGAKSVNTNKLPGGPLAGLPPGPALGAASAKLKAFLNAVKRCEEGLVLPVPGAARGGESSDVGPTVPIDEEGGPARSSLLAVFVPTSDLD